MKDMIKLTKKVDLTGYTFIVPAVAVGNVAQLAVDLLIHNAGMTRIGQAFCPDFIPFLGADPYDKDSSDICTTADFYISEDKRIIALQIRSPPVNKLDNFFANLEEFFKERQISKVIILTSKWQFVRVDSELRSAALRYVASPSMEAEHGQKFEELKWSKLDKTVDPLSNESRLEINGGGFALSLFEFLSKNKISCAILLKFCSEGNNSPDAKELAFFLNQWISLVPKDNEGRVNWKEPPSWLHIFGHEAPREIY